MVESGGNWSAILTPPGSGAIGVVRLAGPDAAAILDKVFIPCRGTALKEKTSNRLHYGHFVDAGEVIDDGLAVRIGEADTPAFDVSVHGGIRILERLLQAFESLGAHCRDIREHPEAMWPAMNGLDADFVSALARAKSERAVRFLAWQRVHLPAYLESLVSRCVTHPRETAAALTDLIGRAPAAETMIDGARVVIVGPPNSGKSTLLNCLAGRPVAVVSPRAGTTRDWVTADVEFQGVPVQLIDTAGQHTRGEPLEQLAMQMGRRRAASAQLCLVVLDGAAPVCSSSMTGLRDFFIGDKAVLVLNKTDLGLRCKVLDQHWPDGDVNRPVRHISAKTGAGTDQLVDTIQSLLGFAGWSDEAPALFCQRQVRIGSDILSMLPGQARAAAQCIRDRLLERVSNPSVGRA